VGHRGAGYRIVLFLAAGMVLAALALAFFENGDTRRAIINAALAAVSLRVGIHSYAEAQDAGQSRARRTRSSSHRSS
jgi:hypothetical protein